VSIWPVFNQQFKNMLNNSFKEQDKILNNELLSEILSFIPETFSLPPHLSCHDYNISANLALILAVANKLMTDCKLSN